MHLTIIRRERGNAISMDVYADNLVSELRQIRPQWTITEIAPNPWWDGEDNPWHSGTGLRKYYERFWQHPRQVKQQETDLFHIIDHSNAHVAYWLMHLGKPIVVTCHDLVQFIYPEILREQARFPAFSTAMLNYSVRGMLKASQVIAVSSNTANDVEKILGIERQKIVVIPNGTDKHFHPLLNSSVEHLRQKYTTSPDEVCLLNVGSSHHRKNLLTVLKVLHILVQDGTCVRLWKVGDDFTADQKAFIQTHGLEQKVIYLGNPNQDLLLQIYNAADILIAPSLYEGFGLTVLEAMACGTPVITSNVSSLPEVAGDAAILVDPMNVQAMSEAVLQLLNTASYRQVLREKGMERVNQFTWRRTAEQVAQVYENLTIPVPLHLAKTVS
ncbi:MAG: glycosyltransferase family 4 protein [Myxacorys chilensis ATA2-1-KO14]|nr:glycosyltransferase family 4 protein [Myxacorys chilensis ATA2-1-KO14]